MPGIDGGPDMLESGDVTVDDENVASEVELPNKLREVTSTNDVIRSTRRAKSSVKIHRRRRKRLKTPSSPISKECSPSPLTPPADQVGQVKHVRSS